MPDSNRKQLSTGDNSSLVTRIKKINGQAAGVQRMIETDRYCIDIIQQLTALTAAADNLALLILGQHIEGCVADAVREQGDKERIAELMATLRKVIRR